MERTESLILTALEKLSDRVFALDRKPRRLSGQGPLFSTVAGAKALEILLFDHKTHPYWTKLEALGRHLKRHAEVLLEVIEGTPPPKSLLEEGGQPFSRKGRWVQERAREVLAVFEYVSACEAFLVSESLVRKAQVGELLGSIDATSTSCSGFLSGVDALTQADFAWQQHVLDWKKKSALGVFPERSVF